MNFILIFVENSIACDAIHYFSVWLRTGPITALLIGFETIMENYLHSNKNSIHIESIFPPKNIYKIFESVALRMNILFKTKSTHPSSSLIFKGLAKLILHVSGVYIILSKMCSVLVIFFVRQLCLAFKFL